MVCIDHSQSCPHCRAEGKEFSHVINKGLRSEINQLEVKCSNHDQGCKWTGELGTLKTHLESDKGCGFVEVDCPNGCCTKKTIAGWVMHKKTTMQQSHLDKHLKTECYLWRYQCGHCNHQDSYYKITGKGVGFKSNPSFVYSSQRYHVTPHYDTCHEFPLTCQNKCGAGSIKRKNMNSHCSECPWEPAAVQCPFAEAGCKDHLCRYQLEDHMTSSVQQHLLLVMNDHKRVKERLRETEAKLEELTTKTRQ